MNCRIIKTAQTDLLVFRDMDEEYKKIISFQVYPENGHIAKQSIGVDHLTTEQISVHIQDISQEKAEQTVNVLLALFTM